MPYLVPLLILIAFVWGQVTVNLTLPDYMSKIVNDGILKKDLDSIWANGQTMLIITILGGLCVVVVGFLASRISTGYVRRLREAVFEKVENFSLSEFDSFSSSSLITRATNDMQQIQNVLSMILRMAFMAPFMGIGAVIKAYDIAPSMSWIILLAIGVIMALVIFLFIVVVPKFSLIQKLVDKLGLQMREMLTGVRVIRAYNNDKTQQDKFNKTNVESTKLNVFVNRIMMLMSPIMTLIMGLTTLAVIWVGAYVINDGNLQVGDLLALMQYVSQTIISFLLISVIFIMVPRAAVSMKRVAEILNIKPKITDSKSPTTLPAKIKGVVSFKNVDFGYDGSQQQVLSNISFTAEPGQMTAIIGGTGSGKTSILKLIPRLYDVSNGSITIDDVDIRDVSQHDLHKHIGYIPQKAALFSGSVNDNLAYGNPSAIKKDVENAAKIAQVKEFIDDLPDGMKSSVAQAGNNLSGGQKQRLSIARALVKKPEIYLFDDSFSALDFKTDAILRHALNKEISKATFLVVAQRISTIMQAEKIIVLDDGKIVGIGTHKELLKKSKVYREIAESQLSSDELKENR